MTTSVIPPPPAAAPAPPSAAAPAELIDLTTDDDLATVVATEQQPRKVIMLVLCENDPEDPHIHYKFLPEDVITQEMRTLLAEVTGYTSFFDLSAGAQEFFNVFPDEPRFPEGDINEVDEGDISVETGRRLAGAWVWPSRDNCPLPPNSVITSVINIEFCTAY